MLINRNIKIIGKKVILVPYRKEHVAKYHEWMKSEELLKLTASLPLTLEEEYDMQQSWMTDETKCTFIILDKVKYEETGNEIESMIGDTNLFFLNDQETITELEIMIAENWARGKHCGQEATYLMIFYGIVHLYVKQFIVKITMDNSVSIEMFKKIGFIKTSQSEVFKEVTMEKIVDDQWLSTIKNSLCPFEIQVDPV